MGTKAKSKRSGRIKNKLSQQNWPAILVALAILIGLVMAGKDYFVNPSEAARRTIINMQQKTNKSTTAANRSAESQGFIDEASRLYHEEYNRCYVMSDLKAKCKCMAGVVKKLEALRERIIATGGDYQNLIDFWVDYYIKLIQQTLTALGCDLNGNVVTPAAASSTLSSWTRWFNKLF